MCCFISHKLSILINSPGGTTLLGAPSPRRHCLAGVGGGKRPLPRSSLVVVSWVPFITCVHRSSARQRTLCLRASVRLELKTALCLRASSSALSARSCTAIGVFSSPSPVASCATALPLAITWVLSSRSKQLSTAVSKHRSNVMLEALRTSSSSTFPTANSGGPSCWKKNSLLGTLFQRSGALYRLALYRPLKRLTRQSFFAVASPSFSSKAKRMACFLPREMSPKRGRDVHSREDFTLFPQSLFAYNNPTHHDTNKQQRRTTTRPAGWPLTCLSVRHAARRLCLLSLCVPRAGNHAHPCRDSFVTRFLAHFADVGQHLPILVRALRTFPRGSQGHSWG